MAMNQEVLHTEKILADRKIFFLDLKENARGRVVKITEDVSGNRDTIMVPAEILGDFIEALTDIKRLLIRRTKSWLLKKFSSPRD